MNKQWIACVLMAAFLSVFKVSDAHAVIVNLNVLDSHIEVGEDFGVEVWVDSEGLGEALLAFGFDVTTSGSSFSYLGHVIGNGFDDLSGLLSSADVSGDAFPGISDDNVRLATLNFSADSVGIDTLALDGAYDGVYFGLFYEWSGFDILASIDIAVLERSVPEPSTLALVAIVWVLLSARRRLNLN